MARPSIADPLKAFRFILVVDGFQMVGFKSCSGLAQATDVIDFRHSEQKEVIQKLPGLSNSSPITLSKGMMNPLIPGAYDFLDWASQVIDGNTGFGDLIFRKDLWLIQYNRGNPPTPARMWYITDAWPSNFRPVGDLESQTSEIAIEEIEIQTEGLMRYAI